MRTHAATIFTAHEMLTAYVAERLDRLVDAMLERGHARLGIVGSAWHTAWLCEHIAGMRHLPVAAIVDPFGAACAGEGAADAGWPIDAPVLALDEPQLPSRIDTLLVSDDRHEQPLHDLALRTIEPGILVFRLYHRLPIGTEPLPGTAAAAGELEPKPRTIHPALRPVA